MCRIESPIAYAAIALLFAFAANSYAGYSGGTGEPNSPFKIATIADWQELMTTPADWDKHFVLTADIDVSGVTLSPVGNDANNFTGIFDGNDHIIRNAHINTPDADYIGLFGYIRQNGQIVALGVENVIIKGRNYVGALVGRNAGGAISKCHSAGLVSGDDTIGGLVGRNSGGIIKCYSSGTVVGVQPAGGLVGWNDGSVSRCYSTGSVIADWDVGGLVGWNIVGLISNSYSTVSVTGGWVVGGLVGDNAGCVANSYSTGSVIGEHNVGGLAGSTNGTVYTSFWDVETSGWATSSGGTAKTTEEMKTETTFTLAMWDFVGESANGTEDFWAICEGTNYPRLVWQIPQADWVCPDGVGLEDFGYFAGYWGSGEGGAVDLDGEEGIGFGDLMVFCEEWLRGR